MLQDNVDKVKQSIFNDLNRGQDLIFTGLVTNAPINRIPEPLFTSYFLPGFLGNNPNQNWMLEWIGIAGSPSSEVSVFDPSTQQELFRVPPVLSSRNILLPSEQGGLNDIFKRHEMMGSTLGASKTNYLFNALEEKSAQAVSTYKNDTDVRWSAILTRYGYTPANPITSSGGEQDMFDY